MRRHMTGLLLVLAGVPAWADITARYEMRKGEDLVISYRDDSHIRMDMGGDARVLLTGDRVYMLRRDGGRWMAMDMSGMQGLMPGMAGRKPAGKPEGKGDAHRLVDTGTKETVAGYEGTLYRIEGGGGSQGRELVIGTHEHLARIQQAMMTMASKMAGSLGMPGMPELPEGMRGGLLRSGREMKLESVDTSARDAGWFSLPADAVVQDPAGMMPPGMQGRPDGRPMGEGIKRTMPGY